MRRRNTPTLRKHSLILLINTVCYVCRIHFQCVTIRWKLMILVKRINYYYRPLKIDFSEENFKLVKTIITFSYISGESITFSQGSQWIQRDKSSDQTSTQTWSKLSVTQLNTWIQINDGIYKLTIPSSEPERAATKSKTVGIFTTSAPSKV